MKKLLDFCGKHWQTMLLLAIFLAGLWLRTDGLATKAQVDLVETDFGRDILVGRHIGVGWGGWLLTPHSSWELLSSSPLHFWMVGFAYVLSGSEIGVYYLYALCSLLLIWMAWLIGKELSSRSLGLLMATTTAILPVFVGFAVRVSQVSLVPVFAAIIIWGLLRFFHTRKMRFGWLVMFAATVVMLLHSSGLPYGLFAVITLALLLLRKRAGWWLWAHFGVALLLMLLVVWRLVFAANAVDFVAVFAAALANVLQSRLLFPQSVDVVLGTTHIKVDLLQLVLAGGVVFVWLWLQAKHVARLWLWLLLSASMMSMAPTSLSGLSVDRLSAPWSPILVWFVVALPWIMKPNWFSRTLRLLVLGSCLWLVFWRQPWQITPRVLVAQAPFSLMQLLHADAIQTQFIDDGFEIWSPIWDVSDSDPRAGVISDWYSGGWWFLWERLERVPGVTLVSYRDSLNNIHVKKTGGGVYVVCPDSVDVSSQESMQNLKNYQISPSVLGTQWLSEPTAFCIVNLWGRLNDKNAQSKTWVIGRVIAPGSKTGAYALVKYHN